MQNNLIDIEGMMYAPDFSKSKATATGENLVAKIFEDGVKDPYDVYSNIVRLKAVIDSADKAFRDRLSLSNAVSHNGVTFTPKNGAESLNYAEDAVYAELENKLKQRAELLKVASKSNDPIFDHEGCEVPKVSKKYTKSSITITF